jgi:hypothetical protein
MISSLPASRRASAIFSMASRGQTGALLEELLLIDLASRWQNGDGRKPDNYLKEFPELFRADGLRILDQPISGLLVRGDPFPYNEGYNDHSPF